MNFPWVGFQSTTLLARFLISFGQKFQTVSFLSFFFPFKFCGVFIKFHLLLMNAMGNTENNLNKKESYSLSLGDIILFTLFIGLLSCQD